MHRRPRLALLATGDELVEPGMALQRGAIPDSVSPGVAALAQDWGAGTVARWRLPDDLPTMDPAVTEALQAADLLVVTGGASVGERDFAKAMFEGRGLELIFSKVAIKPGKPAWFGRAGRPARARAARQSDLGDGDRAAVPGAAARRPVGTRSGRGAGLVRWARSPVRSARAATRETFVRARRRAGAAEPLDDQESHAQHALAEADLLIRRRPGAPPAAAGERAELLCF